MSKLTTTLRFIFLLVLSVSAEAHNHISTRALTSEETQSLIKLAGGNNPRVVKGEVFEDGESAYAWAQVLFPPHRVSTSDCIGVVHNYFGKGSNITWERSHPNPETYFYWRNESNCKDLSTSNSVYLGTLIDTQRLYFILSHELKIREMAINRLSEKLGRPMHIPEKITGVKVDYSRYVERYIYSVYYEVDECKTFEVKIEIDEIINLIEAWFVVC